MPKRKKSVDIAPGETMKTAFASNAKISGEEIRRRHGELLDSLPIITYIVEPRPPFAPVYISRNINMLGYTEEDWFNVANLWINIIHEDDRERVLAETKAAMEAGGETDCEYRVRARDNSVYWFYDKGRFARDEQGNLVSWEGILLDITERKRAENARLESENKYRQLVEQASDAIFIFDRAGVMLEVNPRACEIVGCESEELLGTNVKALFAVEELTANPLRLDELFAGERILSERQIRAKNGTPVSIEISAKQLDKQRAQAIVRDISERKQLAENLRLLESAVFQSRDAILLTTAELDEPGPQIIFANPAFSEMTGYRNEEIVGKTPRILQGEKTDRAVLDRLRRDVSEGKEFRGEAINYRKDNSEYWVEWNVTPLKNEAGEVTHFLAVQQDVTERKHLEEQLRQSQKMEAVGRLAGGIAHDFNNLLTVINGYGDLTLHLLEKDSPVRENVEQIKQAGERAASLTRQLLAFSRTQIFRTRLLNLNQIIGDMKTMLRHLIPENIEFSVNLSEAVGSVRADSGQIEQVIMNLVVNARDAMPDGGRLTIAIDEVRIKAKQSAQFADIKPGDYVRLTISDTGTGIGDEVKKQIFEPFFTTKSSDAGTGLGLSTAYGIVSQSNGYIAVESEIGRGATFIVYLPRVFGEAVEDVAPSAIDAKKTDFTAGAKIILLVEDEEIVLNMVRQILLSWEYNVIAARDGKEALDICRRFDKPIDLLITDIVMPHMNGRELAERATAFQPQMRVLFMSGYTDDQVLRQGISEENAHFIQKPFAAPALAQKVLALIGDE